MITEIIQTPFVEIPFICEQRLDPVVKQLMDLSKTFSALVGKRINKVEWVTVDRPSDLQKIGFWRLEVTEAPINSESKETTHVGWGGLRSPLEKLSDDQAKL